MTTAKTFSDSTISSTSTDESSHTLIFVLRFLFRSFLWREDLPRFRGPQDNGVSLDDKAALTWSDGQMFTRSNCFLYCIEE
jgi:hypothetical protein